MQNMQRTGQGQFFIIKLWSKGVAPSCFHLVEVAAGKSSQAD